LSVIVADHRRWHRRKQKSLFLATIADHRRLPPAWKIYEKWVNWVVFSSTSKEIINWSLTEIMNVRWTGPFCALVGNFETHRLSSATITDVWELSCIRDRR
jgi:hypothetical protein